MSDDADLAVLVIADDLTGANATGASFARRGFRTMTVRGGDDLPGLAGGVDVDVLVVDTSSRHLGPVDAADRVRATLEEAPPATLVVNRTDTLRGKRRRRGAGRADLLVGDVLAAVTCVDELRARVGRGPADAGTDAGRGPARRPSRPGAHDDR